MVQVTYTGPDVWVGSELGLLKGINVSKGTFVNYGNLKSLNKSQGVTALSRQAIDGGERIIFGTHEGSARIYETQTNEFSDPICCGSSPVCGVVALPDDSVLTCTEKGLLKRWKENECVTEKQIGSNIQTMVANTTQTLIAAGGEENDLKLWNVESMDKPVFSAKNVRNDFLNLRVPVWVKAVEFFKDSDSEIVVGTGNHTVRTYDTRVKRRPVLDMEYHEHPITAISLTKENKTVVVGNSAGFMGELDLRTGKQVAGFKGICGSIRAISCHVSQPYVVTCGLDRFVRVYDLNTRRLEKKVYLKSNLNCIALSCRDIELHEQTESRKRTKEEEDEEVEVKEEDEDEGVWEGMKVIKEKKKKTNEHDIDALDV